MIKVTSWPQLISKLLVTPACFLAASDWPRTFFTPKVFLLHVQTIRQTVAVRLLGWTPRLVSICQWSKGYLADNLGDKFVMRQNQLFTPDTHLFQLAIIYEAAKHKTVQ